MKIKAAVLYEHNTPLVIEEIDLAPPGPGEVLVKIAAVGLCHSDLHVIKNSLNSYHPLPVVLGHEAAGIVEAVGEGVTRLMPGDHVSLIGMPHCGNCWYCAHGEPALCEVAFPVFMTSGRLASGETRLSKNGQELNHFLAQSSFAEYAVVDEGEAIKIPDDMPLDKACLLGCAMVTGVGAVVNAANVEVGSHVAVIGCGGIGMSVIQGAVLAGANKIVAVDLNDKKLEMARKFGATHVINPTKEEPIMRAVEICDGRVDYAFEAIGLSATMDQALNMVRRGGAAVIVGAGALGDKWAIEPINFMLGKRILGTLGGNVRHRVDIPAYAELYKAGKLNIDDMVTQTIPLEKINEGFETLERGDAIRTVVVF